MSVIYFPRYATSGETRPLTASWSRFCASLGRYTENENVLANGLKLEALHSARCLAPAIRLAYAVRSVRSLFGLSGKLLATCPWELADHRPFRLTQTCAALAANAPRAARKPIDKPLALPAELIFNF